MNEVTNVTPAKLKVVNALTDEGLYRVITDMRNKGRSYEDIAEDLDKMGYRSKHRKPLAINTIKFIAQKGPTSRSAASGGGKFKAALKALLAVDMPSDKKVKAITNLLENDES